MDEQLESVLDAYATSEPGPCRATLIEWIRDYPQFARELTEFTAQWQMLQWADDTEAPDAAAVKGTPEDDRLLLRAMSAAQSAFYALQGKRQGAPAPTAETQRATAGSLTAEGAPITSLLGAAKRVGLTHAELRDRVALSDALLRKLDRRLIDPLTIPVRLVSNLAGILKQRIEDVAAYLALPPTFALSAQHRSSKKPTLPKSREDFFEAVRSDTALTPEQRQEILALPRPDVGDNPVKD